MIAGKLAELAAKRAMTGFIKSRLGSLRAFNKFSAWGYLMPRTYFSKLYNQARDIERASANLLALSPKKYIPRSLMTPGVIKTGRKYLYIVEGDVYTPEGAFFKSRYVAIPTDYLGKRGEMEQMGTADIAKSKLREEGWEVRNPRLIKVLHQE